MDREELNHQAYEDIMNCKSPSMSDEYYMSCYRFWVNCDPSRFDFEP